jgi:hypothetical protein
VRASCLAGYLVGEEGGGEADIHEPVTSCCMPIIAADIASTPLPPCVRTGTGKQEVGALTNLISFWIIGIPLAYALAFRVDLGLQGLWLGLTAVNLLQGGIMVTISYLTDWEAEARAAREGFELRKSRSMQIASMRQQSLAQPLLTDGGDTGERC